MIAWRSRLTAGLVILAALKVHAMSTADVPNCPLGMLVFHGSAAAVDLLLIYAVPALVVGRLCDDMQTLCLVSIVVNFIGWILYMAYAPPVIFDVMSWSLCYVQFGRLLIVDVDDVDSMGLHLVRRPDHVGA